jgi:hypothetical protein
MGARKFNLYLINTKSNAVDLASFAAAPLNANLLKSQSLVDITAQEIEAELETDEKPVSLLQPH